MLRLAIIDDNRDALYTLARYLQNQEMLEVVATCERLDTFSDLLPLEPDMIIAGTCFGTDPGAAALRALRAQLPQAGIIVRIAPDDDSSIRYCLQAGVLGYVLKDEAPSAVLDAVRRVHRGEGVMNGVLLRKAVSFFQRPAPSKPSIETFPLTTREKEMVRHLMNGLSYKKIAATCFVSLETVNSHIKKIYSKLDVRSRAEISARYRID